MIPTTVATKASQAQAEAAGAESKEARPKGAEPATGAGMKINPENVPVPPMPPVPPVPPQPSNLAALLTPLVLPHGGSGNELALEPEEREGRDLRIQHILTAAAAHPLYRDILQPTVTHAHSARIEGTKLLAEWPVLHKSALHAALLALQEQLPRNGDYWRGLYWSPSGGSSDKHGLPTFFPTDKKENHEMRRILAERMAGVHTDGCTDGADYSACGVIPPSTIALNLFSSSGMYRALEIFEEFCDCAGATSLPVSFECEDQKAMQLAARFGANTLCGAPPRLMQFAMAVQQQMMMQEGNEESVSLPPLQIDRILWGAEPLQASKKQLLRDVLGVRHFTSVYGSAETGVWAFQPDWLEDGKFVYFADMVYVEILPITTSTVSGSDNHTHNRSDGSDDATTANISDSSSDETGAITVTNLLRQRFPLVRYRTGDVGKLQKRRYAGRAWDVLVLEGREHRSFMIGSNYFTLAAVESAWEDMDHNAGGSDVLEWQCSSR
jgi:phenylacetate-CoA ligase